MPSTSSLKPFNALRQWLLDQPIRTKVVGAFIAIFALIAISAGTVFLYVLDGARDLARYQSTEVPLLQLANDLRYYDAMLTDAFRGYVMNPQDTAAYDRYFAFAQRYDETLATARHLATQPQDQAIFAQLDAISAEMILIEESLIANPNLSQFGDIYTGRYQVLKDQLTAQLDAFFAAHAERTQAEQAHIAQRFLVSLGLIVFFVGVLLVLCFIIASMVSRYVVGTLQTMTQATHEFAKGNMEVRIPVVTKDELGVLAAALNHAAENELRYTRELENARRAAEEATRMKDLFLATMSHELRTPLNAMTGFLHLMIYSDQLDEDNTYMAERSLANTQRLLTLINNILDLSRIATGGLQIVPAPFQIRYMIAGLYNDLKMLAHDKGLRLTLDVDPTLPDTVRHDETRLSQIITNLVSNAIKFTESGEVNLKVQRKVQTLQIIVKDTGIGIPTSKLELIFDDFFQVDGSSTRQHQGAGLGLAIVKRLVMLMNGKIHVDSALGKGSTFTVELPLELPAYVSNGQHAPEHSVFAKSIEGARLVPSLN